MRAKDFTIILSTGSWHVARQKVFGMTIYKPTIEIRPSPSDKNRLDTWVHETLHASAPSLTEKEVMRLAGDIARVLWKAGYRES